MEELINSEKDQPAEKPEETPGQVTKPGNPPREVNRRSGSGIRILVLTVIAVVLVVLLVLLARWLYHVAHHNDQTGTSNTSQTASKSSSSAKKQTGKSSQPAANNSSTTSSSAASNSNSNLPNSGAGDTIAIFAGAGLAAAGLHYIISVRRAGKTGN